MKRKRSDDVDLPRLEKITIEDSMRGRNAIEGLINFDTLPELKTLCLTKNTCYYTGEFIFNSRCV